MTLVRVGGLRLGEAEQFEGYDAEDIRVWMDRSLEMSPEVTLRMADYPSDLPDRDLTVDGVY